MKKNILILINSKKVAFTLAEVLVTLMIIGVIATMTIPGLKKSAEERERVSQLKKTYSTITGATEMLGAEYGSLKHWQWDNNAVIMDRMYIPKFNVAKNCKNSGDCFDASYRTKTPDGTVFSEFQSADWYTFITADGVFWTVSKGTNQCNGTEGTPAYILNNCILFEVDLNGVKKPNIIGVDIFGFTVTPEGAFPFGGCPGCSDDNCGSNSSSGWACTAKLLKEGKYSW